MCTSTCRSKVEGGGADITTRSVESFVNPWPDSLLRSFDHFVPALLPLSPYNRIHSRLALERSLRSLIFEKLLHVFPLLSPSPSLPFGCAFPPAAALALPSWPALPLFLSFVTGALPALLVSFPLFALLTRIVSSRRESDNVKAGFDCREWKMDRRTANLSWLARVTVFAFRGSGGLGRHDWTKRWEWLLSG